MCYFQVITKTAATSAARPQSTAATEIKTTTAVPAPPPPTEPEGGGSVSAGGEVAKTTAAVGYTGKTAGADGDYEDEESTKPGNASVTTTAPGNNVSANATLPGELFSL